MSILFSVSIIMLINNVLKLITWIFNINHTQLEVNKTMIPISRCQMWDDLKTERRDELVTGRWGERGPGGVGD